MPQRNIEGQYPYAYQGQEKDPETGMEAFELRLWDARLGRWLTTDPYGQYASPYLGMGNNPVNGIDSDGGFWEELGNWFSGNGWNSNAALEFQANGGHLGDWVGDPFDGYRVGSKSRQIDGGTEVTLTIFNAVQDFDFKGEDISGFRINAGLQAGAEVLGVGIGANLYSTTLLEWTSDDGWYKIWDNVEGGSNYPKERRYQLLQFEVPVGAIGIVPVVAEFGADITTINGRLHLGKINTYAQLQATSLLQIGVESDLLKDQTTRMYSQHGINFGASAIIGIQLSANTKFSVNPPKF